MSCADFTGILRIVLKILPIKHSVFITDQPVFGHHCRIKFHLQLHILADRKKRSRHLLFQNLFRLPHAVNIGIVSVALIGQRLHFIVLDIAGSKPQHRQKNAGLPFFGNQLFQLLLCGHTDIQIPVRGKNNPVISSLNEIFPGNPVRRLKSSAPIGAAARFQRI